MNIFKNIHTGVRRFGKMLTVALTGIGLLTAANASANPKTQSNTGLPQHQFTVVIDAGHGAHDFGAVDNGANEKDINLNVAKKFAALVKKKMKDVKVVMTRGDDTFISLQERANIANRNKADLFISIHTNSVDKNNPNRTKVSGASVYTLGPQKDENNLKVARRENSVIELESNYHQKYSGFDPNKDESYIIFEMAQKKNLGQSLKLADKIQKELVATAGRKDRGVKQAGFWVLWATSMPSVLVELDFICNPDEAAFLDSNEGQDKLAEALFNGLDNYIKGSKKAFADEVKNQGGSLHNMQAGADLRSNGADNQMVDDVAAVAVSEDGVNTLAASTPKQAKERQHLASTQTKANNYKPRRRRSDSSKALSDSKSFETGEIALKSETDLLAVKEKEPEEVKPEKPAAPANEKNGKKNRKDKKKVESGKKKDVKPEKKLENKKEAKKEAPKETQKEEIKSRPNNSHMKTFTVKSSSEIAATTYKANVEKANAATATEAAPAKMVYKIQLLESEVEKKADDPAFCGLVPSGMFRENGKYKYTYGGSTNRREIEQKLWDIKSLIPGATIIVRME